MDAKTGNIYYGTTEYLETVERDLGRKLLPLKPKEAKKLTKLSPWERIQWAEQRNRRKNARKLARKARRAQRCK